MSTLEIRSPNWPSSIREGVIAEWLKTQGDHVDNGEPIASIEVDKVQDELLAPAAGRITQIFIREGQSVAANTMIAILETS